MLWFFILGGMALAAILLMLYLIKGMQRFSFFKKLRKKNKSLSTLLAAGIVFAIGAVSWICFEPINAAIILIHLGVIWMIADFIWYRIGKAKNHEWKRYYAGGFALIFTFCYLCMGWYCDHHVWETHYEISTEKAVGSLRVVQIADSHVGTTFHGDGFAKHMEKIQSVNPDVVLVTGDYVDDDTCREDMIASCAALGKLKPTYGVYFAFGNHDKGYYGDEFRGYSAEELVAELEKNGVQVLQDETVLIDDRFYIIGRQDRSETQLGRSRASMDELTADLDPTKYTIVMDHQPHDYDNQERVCVDLVLSGHTHGGQLFPINYMGEWTKENEKTYGHVKRTKTHFIVTSGISDWAIKFKTGCISEYVVIDIGR